MNVKEVRNTTASLAKEIDQLLAQSVEPALIDTKEGMELLRYAAVRAAWLLNESSSNVRDKLAKRDKPSDAEITASMLMRSQALRSVARVEIAVKQWCIRLFGERSSFSE